MVVYIAPTFQAWPGVLPYGSLQDEKIQGLVVAMGFDIKVSLGGNGKSPHKI